jgi:hypothetical protein
MKRFRRRDKPMNNIFEKNNKSKRSCRPSSTANSGKCKSKIKKRKRLFRTCNMPSDSKSSREELSSNSLGKKKLSIWHI